MNKEKFVGAIIMLIGIIGVISVAVLIFNCPVNKKIVDCYDRMGNKVMGITCEEEHLQVPGYLEVILVFFLITMLYGELLVLDTFRRDFL
jgi:uncharacterized membrane protein